jgi:hypothetical protein
MFTGVASDGRRAAESRDKSVTGYVVRAEGREAEAGKGGGGTKAGKRQSVFTLVERRKKNAGAHQMRCKTRRTTGTFRRPKDY